MVNIERCDPVLTDDYARQILSYLQGWIIKPGKHDVNLRTEYARSFVGVEEIEDSVKVVNTISFRELEDFFYKSLNQVLSYLWWDYLPRIPQVHEALIMWTAGLIWKKYNIKPVELRDGTTSFGYGDQLITKAKNVLKNYKRIRMRSLC